MKRCPCHILFIMMLLISVITCAEDVITLTNGRVIRGVISKESTSQVMVEMPGLQLILKRNEIKSIKRIDEDARKAALEEVHAPRPHEEAFYPKDAQYMFHALNDLDVQLEDWQNESKQYEQLQKQLKSTAVKIGQLTHTIDQRRKVLADMSDNLEAPPALKEQKIGRYNQLAEQTNASIKQYQKALKLQETLEEKIELSYAQSNLKREAYAKKVKPVVNDWALFVASNAEVINDETPWFEALSQRMAAHPLALTQAVRPEEPDFVLMTSGHKEFLLTPDFSGHYYLPVLLNGIHIEEMMIDTGATFSLLPESVGKLVGAKQIGPTIKTKVADGRDVDIIPALLEYVEIYGQRFGPVQVGLLPDEDIPEFVNLLGMNVLSEIPLRLTPEGLYILIKPAGE